MEINEKRTCSIALMSGKGGSGKTTLALSMASLLSSCGVKTLLIDCDISTNGATYFFEEEMAYYSNHLDTLHELLVGPDRYDDIGTYPVNEFFDFLPSVTKIGEVWTAVTLSLEKEAYLKQLFDSLSDNYEVVLYDCQAGYAQILETVIRMSDRNLMVLEADSVSASAVRNLFLKLNNVWENKRIYQIFNKATKEEAEIYSKVTSGTMFDNIGCILFDWTVRRAFSISKIPDMINTSVDYGIQVCDLCIALIKNPEISKKLLLWTKNRKLEALKSKEKYLQTEIKKVEHKFYSIEKLEKQAEKLEKRLTILKLIRSLLMPILLIIWINVVHSKGGSFSSLFFSDEETELSFLAIIAIGITLTDMFIDFPSKHTIKSYAMSDFHYDQTLKDLHNSLEIVRNNIENLKKGEQEINKGKIRY